MATKPELKSQIKVLEANVLLLESYLKALGKWLPPTPLPRKRTRAMTPKALEALGRARDKARVMGWRNHSETGRFVLVDKVAAEGVLDEIWD